MKWSVTICRLFGIRICLHASFLLLIVAILIGVGLEGDWLQVFWTMAFLVSAFTCVTLHELGHSVVAQRLGIQVNSITLLPIGGVAALRSLPEKPLHEVAITLAGPAVNVVIYAILFAIARWIPFGGWHYWPGILTIPGFPDDLRDLIDILLKANAIMVLFNLVPAYPMDGGRLLRAALACRMPYLRATELAVTVGKVFAILFMLCSWLKPEFASLLIIGVLIYFAAESEHHVIRIQAALRDLVVEKVMSTDWMVVEPTETTASCFSHIYKCLQDDFPVVEEGRYLGVLTRDAVLDAVRARWGLTAKASDLMQQDFHCTHPGAMLAEVYRELLTGNQKMLPVVQDGLLVGVVTMENLRRYFQVHDELKGKWHRLFSRIGIRSASR